MQHLNPVHRAAHTDTPIYAALEEGEFAAVTGKVVWGIPVEQ